MKLNEDEHASWSPAELGAVLRHQLAAPLEYDLRTIVDGGERTIMAMAAATTVGPSPKTFGDMIRHQSPPLDLLNVMKDFARNGRDNGSLPAEVGTVLYYTAIVLGVVRHQTRITKLDDHALRKGVEWSLGQPWIDESVRQILGEAVEKLPPA